MAPSLREIRMFVAVYEELSFTAAAVRENATQSGVSQHVRNLEDRLGVQLLARNKGVQATPAGAAYYRRCIEVLKAHALARRTLEEFATDLSGEVVIGLMPTMTRSVLAQSTITLQQKHPNVRLRVVEAYSGALTHALRAGQLDFAIVPAPATVTTGIKTTLFANTPEILVSAVGCGLPDGAPVRLADLGMLKLVVPSTANARRHILERYFAEQGVQLAMRLEFDTVPGTLDLVARSDWRTVLPGILIAQDIGAGRLCLNPLVNPSLGVDLVLIEAEHQPLSAAAAVVLDALRDSTDRVNLAPTKLVLAAVALDQTR